jgi:putative transposase
MRAPAGLVSRAKIVLWSASGKTNLEIAQQLEMTNATVGKWRRRFLEQGIAGLHDELRPGRPRPISDERVAQLVRKTRKTKPEGRTHWSIKYERLESPGRCGGLVCGREESDASARTYPADYRRHGTTTLFAALDTANGKVLTQCRKRHRHQEYLDFLREIDKNVPQNLPVHIIVDNYATHKHPRVKRWFAEVERLCERISGTAH